MSIKILYIFAFPEREGFGSGIREADSDDRRFPEYLKNILD